MQNAQEIYRQTISLLPSEEKLQLAALILSDLAAVRPEAKERVSVVELMGSLPAGRGFRTSAEADNHLRGERESWDY
jgi:hypothetical protein